MSLRLLAIAGIATFICLGGAACKRKEGQAVPNTGIAPTSLGARTLTTLKEDTSAPNPRKWPMSPGATAVIGLLDRMPAWTSFSYNKEYAEECAEIERVAAQIAHYDLDDIRSAVLWYDSKSNVEASGKLLILNRYLFDLPKAARRDSPLFPHNGGWVGMPISGEPGKPAPSDVMDLRWPWSESCAGVWRLTGKFGGYFGPPYDAVVAFDSYRANLGKRPGAGD